MKLLLLAFSVAAASSFAAPSPALPSFSDKSIPLPPLGLGANQQPEAPAFAPPGKLTLGVAPVARRERRLVSKMPILAPSKSVESAMPVVKPDPTVDHKLIVKEPEVVSQK